MGYERNAWLEVDLAAVAENVRALKALLPADTLFMAVVKADGYGHGAVPVSRAALSSGADRLGVATIEEALELRRASIDAPIHILSEPPASAASIVVERELVPMIVSMSFAGALNAAASNAGRKAKVHLKIDSGMNRVGVRAEDAAQFAIALKGFPDLVLEGIATHFATADVPNDWDFERQKERFEKAVAEIRDQGIEPGLLNAANSAATILHPETHLGMVRCGITVYGLHPCKATYGKIELKPAMSVKARVAAVKRVTMGEGVSYGLTWRATSPADIALLSLGYADGIHRVLSDKMRVLIGGKACRQVGRVTMDQILVEIPRGMQVKPGDEAVLVGSQDSGFISMDELAEEAGTINYEIACAFSMRLGRKYRG